VEVRVVHRESPRQAIIEVAREIEPDLLVMGAHGHSGIKDLIFGTTINAVRHDVAVPLLIVR
jgi:manganese transport protein